MRDAGFLECARRVTAKRSSQMSKLTANRPAVRASTPPRGLARGPVAQARQQLALQKLGLRGGNANLPLFHPEGQRLGADAACRRGECQRRRREIEDVSSMAGHQKTTPLENTGNALPDFTGNAMARKKPSPAL